MDIKLNISQSLKDYLVEEHTDLKMGARPLKRAIQTQLEDPLAEELLAGKVHPGDEINAVRKDGSTVFIRKNKDTK